MVERYNFVILGHDEAAMQQRPNGQYVEYENYEELEAELSRVMKEKRTQMIELFQARDRVAELEDGHSAIFPYVSDLDKPIGVLIRGLGARYDARGVELVEQRQRIAELEAARLTATADTIRI